MKNQEILINSTHKQLVKGILKNKRIYKSNPLYDDYYNEGLYGLWRGMVEYDEEKGTTEETYYTYRIVKAIDGLRQKVAISFNRSVPIVEIDEFNEDRLFYTNLQCEHKIDTTPDNAYYEQLKNCIYIICENMPKTYQECVDCLIDRMENPNPESYSFYAKCEGISRGAFRKKYLQFLGKVRLILKDKNLI